MTSLLHPIPRRNICCSRGEESLWRESIYYSVLEREGKKGFVRHDFCSQCWAELTLETTYPNRLAYWRVHRQQRERTRQTQSEKWERLLEQLSAYLQRGTPEARTKAFLLALFIQRHKRLILRKEEEEQWLFEDIVREEIVVVPVVPLSFDAVSSYHKELTNEWIEGSHGEK